MPSALKNRDQGNVIKATSWLANMIQTIVMNEGHPVNSKTLFIILVFIKFAYGHKHINHPPIDHPYKCHENTNHSRGPQLSKAPTHTSSFPTCCKHNQETWWYAAPKASSTHEIRTLYIQNAKYHHFSLFGDYKATTSYKIIQT